MEKLSRVDDLIKNQYPNDPAIIYSDKVFTYKQLQNGMMKVASTLLSLDLYRDKIIVLLGNIPEAVMAILGISYIGGTFIPVHEGTKPERLAEIIANSGATAIITDDRFFKITDAIDLDIATTLRAVIDIDNIMWNDPYKSTKIPEICQSIPAYPAALMYTSGTTGKPKGVICPQHKIMAAISSINAYMFHTHNDVIATALPLSHGYGLYQVFTVLEAKGTLMLENNFMFPMITLERIKKWKVTGFAAVPSMIHMIMKIDGWENYLQDLTYITTAGAALPDVTFKKLQEALPNTEIMPMYGQTECVRALYYPRSIQKRHGIEYTSCGICIPDTQTKINSLDGANKGELLIRSPHVMDGYWNNEEETKKTFQNGWLHTGDLFEINENGLHYFLGRNDDIVKVKGERCSPMELDHALIKMPDIIEAAAFSVPDAIWGNRFVLYVSTDSVLTKQDIMHFCKVNVNAFLMPKDVVILDKIPKNENGKISRSLLKKHYANRGN